MNDRLKIKLHSMGAAAPLYREVRRRILQCVAEGKWKPGERLPAESELAELFGVAISTLRAGVKELTSAGVLIRRQGKGTFVAQHDPHSQHFRFSNIYGWQQGKISTRREIVSMRKVRADCETTELLRLGDTASPLVHHVVCTLHGGGAVVGIMEIMLPVSLFPRLKPKDFEPTTENIYSFYQRACGVTVLRMEERVSARTADADTAVILHLRRGHPLLQVERVAYTFNNVPVEVRRRTYEGQQHYYLFTHEELQ
jgi:GntR family transcriptional regulator